MVTDMDPRLYALRRRLIRELCLLALTDEEGDPDVIEELCNEIAARKAELAEREREAV